uniref:FAD-dependent oxidoreductase n=1 Tax=Rothia santali TaxID=2949643 RepID=UPI00359FAEC8
MSEQQSGDPRDARSRGTGASRNGSHDGEARAAEAYDVVVIGGGPVGENAADYAIRGTDRTAALVEAELYGGECSYWACMPSKALLHPLDVVAEAEHLGGIERPVRVSPRELMARRDEWVSRYDDAGQEHWVRSAGITPVRGRGRLAGPRVVEVEGPDGSVRRLEAREAVIVATGSSPAVPEPYRGIAAWGSRDATGVREVPERLALVGGGVVACESARWLSALGSRVTMIVRGDALLGSAEPFAGEAVAESLREQGVTILFGAQARGAEREGADPDAGVGVPHGGPVTLELTGSDGDSSLTVDEVLVATGRRPALDDLGLDAVGLDARDLRGWTHPGGDSPLPEWLYLVGDASGEAPLTHWGKYRARQVGLAVAAAAAGTSARTGRSPKNSCRSAATRSGASAGSRWAVSR